MSRSRPVPPRVDQQQLDNQARGRGILLRNVIEAFASWADRVEGIEVDIVRNEGSELVKIIKNDEPPFLITLSSKVRLGALSDAAERLEMIVAEHPKEISGRDDLNSELLRARNYCNQHRASQQDSEIGI